MADEEETKATPIPTTVIEEAGMLSDLERLTNDVHKWASINFGDNTQNGPHRCVLGMLEEIAELEDALEDNDRAKALDALADIMLYMLDYFARNEWTVATMANHMYMLRHGTLYPHKLSSLRGIRRRLARHQLKKDQGIRGTPEFHNRELKEACHDLTRFCASLAITLNSDLLHCIEWVWGRNVSKRDWVNNPMDAAAKVDAQLEETIS